MKNFKPDRYIFFLLLISLLIRIPGIFDGLPAVYNSTEHFLARTALSMAAEKSLDPGFYIYPTLYTYLLLFLFGCLYLAGTLLGFFADQYDFAVQFLTDPSIIYACSRSLNVFLSLLTIYVLYIFLKRQSNIRTARIAAAILAVSYYFIRYSSFATSDILLIFFSTLTFLYLYKLSDAASRKDFLLAGVFCGLAIASKYNAGFIAIGLLVVVIQKWRYGKIKLSSGIGLSLGGIALGFFATNPLWLVYPERFYEGWRLVSSQMYNAVSAERGTNFLWEIAQLVQHEFVIGALFIGATLFFIFKKEKRHLPVLIVILLTFFYVGTWTKKGIDYLFAIFPAWIILSAFFVDNIISRYVNKQNFTYVIYAFILIPSLASAIHQFLLYTNHDTREDVSMWIVQHIKKEHSVCYDNYHNDLGVFDIERYLSYGADSDRLPEQIKQKLASFATDKRQISFIPILVKNTTSVSETDNPYEEIASEYRRRTLKDLIKRKTTYLIVNSWYYESYRAIDVNDYPPVVRQTIREVQNFYKQLTQNFQPIKVFKPTFWKPGPEISIYDLRLTR